MSSSPSPSRSPGPPMFAWAPPVPAARDELRGAFIDCLPSVVAIIGNVRCPQGIVAARSASGTPWPSPSRSSYQGMPVSQGPPVSGSTKLSGVESGGESATLSPGLSTTRVSPDSPGSPPSQHAGSSKASRGRRAWMMSFHHPTSTHAHGNRSRSAVEAGHEQGSRAFGPFAAPPEAECRRASKIRRRFDDPFGTSTLGHAKRPASTVSGTLAQSLKRQEPRRCA